MIATLVNRNNTSSNRVLASIRSRYCASYAPLSSAQPRPHFLRPDTPTQVIRFGRSGAATARPAAPARRRAKRRRRHLRANRLPRCSKVCAAGPELRVIVRPASPPFSTPRYAHAGHTVQEERRGDSAAGGAGETASKAQEPPPACEEPTGMQQGVCRWPSKLATMAEVLFTQPPARGGQAA